MNEILKEDYQKHVYTDIQLEDDKALASILLQEVSCENYEVVENLIDLGASLNSTDEYNANALHYAAYNNKSSAIKFLLKNKINTDQLNNSGHTPLFSAVINNAEKVFDLLEPIYDINQKDHKGYSVIHYAIANENTSLVSKVLNLKQFDFNTLDTNKSSLLHFAILNKTSKIASLIASHIDLNESLDNEGRNPFLLACKEGNLELLKFFFDQNIKMNIKDINGDSALYIAARSGNVNIVEFLLDHGLSIDFKNTDEAKSVTNVLFGESCISLTEAVKHDNVQAVKYFLYNKTNTEKQDNISDLLLLSVANNNIEIVKDLIDNGVDINSTDTNGNTVLHIALQNKNTKLATFLIDNHANIDMNVEVLAAVNGLSDILNIIVDKNKNKIFTTVVNRINLDNFREDTILTIENVQKDVSKDLLGVAIEYTSTSDMENWESRVEYITKAFKIDPKKASLELFVNTLDNKYGVRFYSSSPESKLVSSLKISGNKPNFITFKEENHASILLFEQIPGVELEEWIRSKKLIEDILQRPVEIEECDDIHELYSSDFNVHSFIMIKETAISIMPNALGISGQYRKSAVINGYQEFYFKNVSDSEKWFDNKNKIIDYICKRVSIEVKGTNVILRETIEEILPKLLNLEDSHKNYPKLYAVKQDGQNKTYFYTFLPEIDLNVWKQNSRRISFRTLFNEPNKVYILEVYEKLNTEIYDENFYEGQLIALHEYAEIPTSDDLMVKNTDLTKDFKGNKVFWGYQSGAKAYYTDINSLSHMMIIGGSGSGKSNLMNGVILSLLNSADKIKKIYLLDLKEGCPEFGMYNNLNSDKITVFSDQTSPIDIRDALYEIEAEMIVRSHYIADQRGRMKKMTYDPIFIIIDEYSQIELMYAEGSEENNAKNQINDILLRIGSKARSANIKLIVQTQDPNFVGNDLKAHLQSRVLLKTFKQSDSVATLTMPDFLDEQGLNHIAFSAGRFVFEDNNENNTIQTELQFPFVDPEKEQYMNYITKAQTETSTDDRVFDKYKEGVVQKTKYLAHTKLLSSFIRKEKKQEMVKNEVKKEADVLDNDFEDIQNQVNNDIDELISLYGELDD